MKKFNIQTGALILLLFFSSIPKLMSQQNSHFLYQVKNKGVDVPDGYLYGTLESNTDSLYEKNQPAIQAEKQVKTILFRRVSRKELDKPGYDKYGNLITPLARKNMREAMTQELNERKNKNKSTSK